MAVLTFRNNLNGFWDFYYGTKVSAGSPKADLTGIPASYL
jgi:hypothetical protein